MRKILLSLFMTAMTCLSASATDFYLWLTQTSGDETSWAVSDLQKITFSGSNVVITASDGSSKTIAMNEVSKLNFQTSPTAIQNVKADLTAKFDGNVLHVNVPEGTIVEVFSATGSLTGKSVVDGSGQVSLSNLPKGVYMVKTGNNIAKVLKR